MTGRDPSGGSLGFHQLLFNIEEITNGYAYGTDQFQVSRKIPIALQRAKGGAPLAGEQWLITKDLGPWTFAAIMNNPGAVASVVAGTNVTVDNSDPSNPIVSAYPSNPIVSASGGGSGGATFRVYSVNGNLPYEGYRTYLTVQSPPSATGGPGFITGTIEGTGWEGFGTFWLDSYNNVLGGVWQSIFELFPLAPDPTNLSIEELDTVSYKTDPYPSNLPTMHIGLGDEKTFLAGATQGGGFNQFFALGETGFTTYMPPAGSTPSSWPGAYSAMFFDQSESSDEEFSFTQPGFYVQGPIADTSDTVTGAGPTYPAVYRGAVLEGEGGPDYIGSLAYPKANVWVDATTGAPGLWISDATGTPYFLGAGLPNPIVLTSSDTLTTTTIEAGDGFSYFDATSGPLDCYIIADDSSGYAQLAMNPGNGYGALMIGAGSPVGVVGSQGAAIFFDISSGGIYQDWVGGVPAAAAWERVGSYQGYLGITSGIPTSSPSFTGSMMSDEDGSIWVWNGATWNHIT